MNNNLNNIFKSGMFSSTPQKETPPYGSNAKPSVFGSQQPFGSTNLFQNTNQPPQQTNFGQPSNLSLFQNQQKPTGSVFGALGPSGVVQPPTTPTNPLSNSWGTTSPFSTTTNTFGNTNTAFGNTNTTFGSQPTTNTFGSQPNTTFGTQPNTNTFSTPFSTTPSFGSFQPTSSLSVGSLKNGTRDTPYQDTRVKDGIGTIEIKNINAMNEYSRKSNDELRVEDYNLGRKAITSGSTSTGIGGFGTSTTFNAPPSSTFGFTTPPVQPPPTTYTNPFNAPPPVQQSPPQTSQNIFNPPSVQQSTFTPSVQQPSSFSFPSTNTPSTNTPSTNTPSTNTPNFPSTTFPNTTFNTTFPSTFPNTTFPSTTLSEPPLFNQSTTIQQPPSTTSTVNYEDPFLLSDIKFEKIQKRTTVLNREVPKPIFSQVEKKPLINLKFRPPRTTQKKKIYTEPSVEEARHLKEIENLIVGFEGKGRIQYLDRVNASEISTTNIEDKITFLKNEVIVSDPPGIGLNKRARVYVEGVFAFSKSQGDFIVGKAEKFPLKGIQERFVYGLKEDVYKKFIDYNYETGLYVYEVNHF